MLKVLRLILPLGLLAGSLGTQAAPNYNLLSFFKTTQEAPYIRHFQYPINTVFNAATYALIEEGFAITNSDLGDGIMLATKGDLDVKITFQDVPFWNQETTTVRVHINNYSDGSIYPDVSLYVSILNRMRQFLLS